MLKKKNILFIILGILVVLYVIAELNKPKDIDWSDSFSSDRKIPYGCYVLRDMLPEIISKSKINDNRESFYISSKINDTLIQSTSLAIITTEFNPDRTDLETLLTFVKNGNKVLISSMNLGNKLEDTLHIKTQYNIEDLRAIKRPLKLNFVNPNLRTRDYFVFQKVPPIYFSSFDTLHSTVLGRDSLKNVTYIMMNYGKGAFLLNTTPHVFTNYHMLYTNHDYATKALSYLENPTIIWDEYYKPDHTVFESQSKIRYILSQDSLRYAYFVLVITIFLFIIFEGKRRQRVMPIVNPPVNSSMEFVETVGHLYFNRKDNKDLAEKKIIHFYDFIVSSYFLKPDESDIKFRRQFAEKVVTPITKVDQIFDSIQKIRSTQGISDEDLVKFIKLIDEIQYKKQVQL